MSSSRTTPKISFNVAIELIPQETEGLRSAVKHDHEVATWKIAFLDDTRKHVDSQLIGPSFDLADVAAGLPNVKAAIDTLHPSTTLEKYHSAKVRVGVQGGILGGETNLLAKKITTLVLVLENRLFCKLVALHNQVRLINEDSGVAIGPWPQGNVVSSDYYSHIPPMATMKPAIWNKLKLETMYRKFSMIWSAPGLRELSEILTAQAPRNGFCLHPPRELPLSVMPWGFEETPQDPSPWWRELEDIIPDWNSSKTQWDPEQGHTYFYFTYLRSTLKHTLLHNWVEVIARVIQLAQAGPDEYKRCLETIFRILYESDQGDDEARMNAWEQLMKHVLKLEDRIPDWRDHISKRYLWRY